MVTKSESVPHFRDGVFFRPNGLHWFITGLFVIGEIVGGGLVTIPVAAVQTNVYVALFLTVIMCIMMSYTAHILARSWITLVERWPEYLNHCRKPYSEIGRRALGSEFCILVSVCVDLTQFGTAVVYLLLSARNIHDFLRMFLDLEIGYCVVVLIVALFLLPVTLLKSPQDFWGAVIVGMFTSVVATVLIAVGGWMDYEACGLHKQQPETRISNYFLAVGTFLFSYGGHSTFPTIQHDMKKPVEFSKSATFAFIVASFLYAPAAIVGYATYGDSLRHSIIPSLQVSWVQYTVSLMITIHCILTLTIACNPLNQDVEDIFRIPQHFGPKRIFVRGGVMLAIVFVALSVPNFGPIVDLIGGSTLALASLVFPCLFYLFLNVPESKDVSPSMSAKFQTAIKKVVHYNKRSELIICAIIMGFGLIFGGAATFSALRSLSTTQFVPPCYVQPFLTQTVDSELMGTVDCCGPWQNITRNDQIECSAPDFEFYL